jgi:hypothetical protein
MSQAGYFSQRFTRISRRYGFQVFITYIFIYIGFVFYSCSNSNPIEPEPEPKSGHITFKFIHHVDQEPVQLDSMMYVNAAGNPFEVNELMYFISDVTLHKSNGENILIDEWKDIHYVEHAIPTTLTWEVFDDLPIGAYDSITFIFGIPEEKNESFMFVNPPEDKMMWPDILGGGYHYMMLNGRWLDEQNEEQIYNFHLGIGQLYKGDEINFDSIYAYVQNYFTVNLPNSSFNLDEDQNREIEIIMNIESWYETPHHFDFNYWGGAIMEIQPAMRMGVENGYDVFAIGSIK